LQAYTTGVPKKDITSAKPLDFSYLNLTDIAQLRTAGARGGNRKQIPEINDDEDMKKVCILKPLSLHM